MTHFFGESTNPKARTPHKCCTCYRVIEAGEVYSRQFTVWDGHAQTWKQCLHCEAMIPYIDYDESFGAEDYIEWEPRNLEQLRVRVHYNKRWRNSAGELYPIPFQKVEAS